MSFWISWNKPTQHSQTWATLQIMVFLILSCHTFYVGCFSCHDPPRVSRRGTAHAHVSNWRPRGHIWPITSFYQACKDNNILKIIALEACTGHDSHNTPLFYLSISFLSIFLYYLSIVLHPTSVLKLIQEMCFVAAPLLTTGCWLQNWSLVLYRSLQIYLQPGTKVSSGVCS